MAGAARPRAANKVKAAVTIGLLQTRMLTDDHLVDSGGVVVVGKVSSKYPSTEDAQSRCLTLLMYTQQSRMAGNKGASNSI